MITTKKYASFISFIIMLLINMSNSHAAINWHFRYDIWEPGEPARLIKSLDYHEACYNGDSVGIIFDVDQTCTVTHIGILFQGNPMTYEYVVRCYINPDTGKDGFPKLTKTCHPSPNPVFVTTSGPGFYSMNLADWGSDYPMNLAKGDTLVILVTNFGEMTSRKNDNVKVCTDNQPTDRNSISFVSDLVPHEKCKVKNLWAKDAGIETSFIIRCGWEVPDSEPTANNKELSVQIQH
ncbi:hypothetical protein JW979_07955 [bacterium]|nr:hypothetical protein [candidate division CSSED10-310 bacterium]